MNFARLFRTPILHMIIYVIQYRCSKKSFRTAASGISENRPCLDGCKFFNVLQK